MIEKRVATNGHIYAKLDSLKQWEKNPRDIYEKNFLELKVKIATLGLFKPLFVMADGKMIGGNMRLPAIKDLNKNILEWTDNKGVKHTVDKRGQFDEVPVTELDFSKDSEGKYHAMLDGVIQEKVFESIEQAMVEYSTADNESAGYYDQQKAAELFLPHQDVIDMQSLTLNLAPPVQMQTFINEYQPGNVPGLKDNKKKEKSKEINVVIKFTPEQFKEIEPKINEAKNKLGLENITDLFSVLIEDFVTDPDNTVSENENSDTPNTEVTP